MLIEQTFLMRPRVGAAHAGLASVVNSTAEVLIAMQRPAEARDTLLPQIATLEAERSSLDAQLLRTRSNLASAYAALGDHDRALALHQRTLDDRLASLPQNHPDTLNSKAQIAFVLDMAKRHREAADQYIEVFHLRRQTLGPLDASTIHSARAAAGVLADSLGRLEDASVLYAEAVRGVEALRIGVGLPEQARQRFFADVAQMYKYYARILVRLGRAREAFDVVELSKARTLAERTRTQSVTRGARLTRAEAEELAKLENDVSVLSARLAVFAGTGRRSSDTDEPPFLTVERDRDRALQRLREHRLALGQKYGWEDMETGPASIDQANAALATDDVFVSFSLLGDALLTLTLDAQGNVEAKALPLVPGLSQSIDAVRRLASARGGLSQLMDGSATQAALLLWQVPGRGFRFQPVDAPAPPGATLARSERDVIDFVSRVLAAAIPDAVWRARRLLLSPDEQLATLPFDVLERNGRKWIEDHEIVVAQSWTLHALLRQREGDYAALRRSELIVFGDPAYLGGTAAPGDSVASRARALSPNETSADSFGASRWYRLPGSASEVSALTKSFGLRSGQNLFTGADATEANFWKLNDSGRLADFRIVHFATHGYLAARDAQLSSVVLAEAGSDAKTDHRSDGYLTAVEWLGARLRSDLVVVAACDSGSGEAISGEGLTGLPFGLFGAGNRSTLLTLWSVYDEATAAFIGRFYSRVRAGRPFSRALAETKREFLRGEVNSAWQAPAFWAAFVLYGS